MPEVNQGVPNGKTIIFTVGLTASLFARAAILVSVASKLQAKEISRNRDFSLEFLSNTRHLRSSFHLATDLIVDVIVPESIKRFSENQIKSFRNARTLRDIEARYIR